MSTLLRLAIAMGLAHLLLLTPQVWAQGTQSVLDEIFMSRAPKFNRSPKSSEDFKEREEMRFGQPAWCPFGESCEDQADFSRLEPGAHSTHLNSMPPLEALTTMFAPGTPESSMYMQLFDTALRSGPTAYTNTVNLVEPTAGASLSTSLNFLVSHLNHYYMAEQNFWDQAKMNPAMSELTVSNYTACVNAKMGSGGGGNSMTRVSAVNECLKEMKLSDLPEFDDQAGGGGAAEELTVLDILFNPVIETASDPGVAEDLKEDFATWIGDAKYTLDTGTGGATGKFSYRYELIAPTNDLNNEHVFKAFAIYHIVAVNLLKPWCEVTNGGDFGTRPGASGNCNIPSNGEVPNTFNPDSCGSYTTGGMPEETFLEEFEYALSIPGLPPSDSIIRMLFEEVKRSLTLETGKLDCAKLDIGTDGSEEIVRDAPNLGRPLYEHEKTIRFLARAVSRARLLGWLVVARDLLLNLTTSSARQAVAGKIALELVNATAGGDPTEQYRINLQMITDFLARKYADMARRGGTGGAQVTVSASSEKSAGATEATGSIGPTSTDPRN
ncbi:MAG: hypothetical protein QY326_00690 [Bdellovibrionota bacterium]|nr:MAG: hypothetical protein QY326_00690 [Bdellovibrionota bacterium]